MSPMDIETMHFKSINFIYFIVFYEILIFTEYNFRQTTDSDIKFGFFKKILDSFKTLSWKVSSNGKNSFQNAKKKPSWIKKSRKATMIL